MLSRAREEISVTMTSTCVEWDFIQDKHLTIIIIIIIFPFHIELHNRT